MMEKTADDRPDHIEVKGSDILDTVLTAGQIFVLFATRLAQSAHFSDDAHIHFRSALNWIQGDGMVFNPGEWVLGTTSPAWTVTLAVLRTVIDLPFPLLAAWTNFAIETGIMLLGLRWMRRAGMGVGMRHGATLVLGLEHWRMYFSATGLEMSFFILAVMLAFETLQSRRWFAAGVVIGLIGWIRPEGSLVWIAGAGALLLAAWRAARGPQVEKAPAPSEFIRTGIKSFLPAFVLSCVIAGILAYYYGSFIPQSLTAKSRAPWFYSAGGLSHVYFFITLGNLTPAYMLTGFQASWGTAADIMNSVLIALIQAGLMLLGAWSVWRRGGTIIGPALVLFELGYYLFHAILQPMIFNWYYIPYYYFSLLLACAGWHELTRLTVLWCASKSDLGGRVADLARGPVHAAILGLTILALAFQGSYFGKIRGETPWQALSFRFPDAPPDEKEWLYIRVADRMRALTRQDPHLSVACTEIGIFGFHFGGHVLDIYGLVSPEALEAATPGVLAGLPPSCREHPLSVWMALKPEFIMSDRRWVPRLPPEFSAEYDEIRWQDIPLAVFARRDVYRTIVVPDTRMASAE